MQPQAAQNYLRSTILTATPEQLQLMLYDGAIRFGEQARAALDKKDYSESYELITRVQKILTELTCSLRHEVFPELCEKLSALYSFAHRKLTDANIEHKIEPLDEAMNVLRFQRETWAMLLADLGKQKAATAAKSLDIPAPSERMEASISMQG
jgi:flagellar secretion chaperone FliS